MTKRLVAFLESVHDLDAADDAWLRRVRASAFPEHSDESSLAMEIEVGDGGWRLIRAPDLDPTLSEVTAASLDAAPAPAVHYFLRRPDTCFAFHEIQERLDELGMCGPEHRRVMEAGMADFVVTKARDGGHRLVLLGTIHRARRRVDDAERRLGAAFGAHVAAALRIRRALRRGATGGEAVFHPDGRLAHAAGSARTGTARERLREAVTRVDRARSGRRSAAERLSLWEPLVAGRWTLVDRFDRDGRRFVVAVRNEPSFAGRGVLGERQRAVARMAAVGLSNQEIGYALGIEPSIVSSHLVAALDVLGIRRRSELPLVLEDSARAHELRIGDADVRVSVHELRYGDELTPAEREVCRLASRGLSNQAIARERGVAPRTVANQLRRIYEKRGLANRTELVRDLLRPPAVEASSS
ncbi:MAG TPA: helix-turn-helix transcriptional regulator [Sandaracinaceae bacterium LLY-WYZ-13_1]|nr:helix-turn-helix transcriptional regulator [Sandaracinaceae bacterium LLY-WYZ-13_1]